MYLLVPAHPGYPGQSRESRKMVVCDVIIVVQIGCRFFRALSSVECQHCIVSALVDVAVTASDTDTATTDPAAAVLCLKQVLILAYLMQHTVILLYLAVDVRCLCFVSYTNIEHCHYPMQPYVVQFNMHCCVMFDQIRIILLFHIFSPHSQFTNLSHQTD